jgi:hypothetical protein
VYGFYPVELDNAIKDEVGDEYVFILNGTNIKSFRYQCCNFVELRMFKTSDTVNKYRTYIFDQ